MNELDAGVRTAEARGRSFVDVPPRGVANALTTETAAGDAGTTTPDVTVAIVGYRSRALLDRCLATFAAATEGLVAELVVLENGTGEDLRHVVRRHVQGATLLEVPRSMAFSKAVNRAVAHGSGRHVVLLNPDTLLGARSLTKLVQQLDREPDVGAVGPKVFDDEARTSLQRSFRRFPSLSTVLCHRYSLLRRLWPSNPWTRAYLRLEADPQQSTDTDWLSGCCLAVRGELFRRLGGLDERYPMFCEDVDLCRRVHAAGLRVVWQPAAEIVHFVGGSRRSAPLRSEWLRHRSMTHYVLKFRGSWNPLAWLLVGGIWARFVLRSCLPGRTA